MVNPFYSNSSGSSTGSVTIPFTASCCALNAFLSSIQFLHRLGSSSPFLLKKSMFVSYKKNFLLQSTQVNSTFFPRFFLHSEHRFGNSIPLDSKYFCSAGEMLKGLLQSKQVLLILS